MTILGTQFIITLGGCRSGFVAAPQAIIESITAAAQQSQLSIVRSVEHHFEPYGLTLVLLLSQSHLIVHTWPEYDTLIVDVFVCVPGFDIQPFTERMTQVSGARQVKMDIVVFEQPAPVAGRGGEE